MNVPSSNRTLSNTPTSYQKLTLRLTPLAPNHNGIIRISAKGTPTTISEGPNSTQYNRITRHQFNNQSLPSKVVLTSPGTSLPKDNTNVSGRLIRSQVTTSTRNWEAQCEVLKQTLDYYKNRIVQLENKHPTNQDITKTDKQSLVYKQRLEETELRMNQENAYLRECMTKLNDQLQLTKETIPNLQHNLTKLEGINNLLTQQLKQKSLRVLEIEQAYQILLQQVQQQKERGVSVNQKLYELEHHIRNIEEQNIQLHKQLTDQKTTNSNLESQVEEEKSKHKTILKDCLSMQKQISSHKQHISQLQDALSKLREDNEDLKKSLEREPNQNLLLTKSVCLNKSFESEPAKLNTSCVTNYRRSSLNDKISLRKCYSTAGIQEGVQSEQFELNVHEQKTEELRLLKTYMSLHNQNTAENLCSILNLAEYFKDSVNLLVTDKSRLQSTIQKYKRLVEITWQNPNIEQSKSEQFITDLIEKCNLYESSLYEKKNTIDSLHSELETLKRQTKNTPRGQKLRYRYLDREDELEKQKIIITKLEKQVDHLNMKLTQGPNVERKIVSLNNSSSSLNGLDKIKSFKAVGASLKKEHTAHSKLKNISGEEILKQMETKLKFYEGQVVPQLEAKVSQYKGMLDSFEREFSSKSIIDDSLHQSRVTIVSNISRIPVDNLRRRAKVNTVSFEDFRDSTLKQSQITKPETTDSSISKQKKKRLDELTPDVSTKVLAAVTLRLCEIAQRMVKNQNYALILPDSIYLINYSDQYVGSLKIKILETPKDRENEIKKYWAPQNIQGDPLGQLSLVWNLGLLLDQTIHGKQFFQNQKQISDVKIPYKCINMNKPFFKGLLERMLEKDRSKRIHLKQIQTRILEEQQSLFN